MNKILTISGRSSAGKSTLERILVESYPHIFDKVISHTSRPIRVTEKDGDDYYFIKSEDFHNIEMMEEVIFSGCRYGASKKELERIFENDSIPIIVVTPEGAQQIHRQCVRYGIEHISLFIDSTDRALMERFLRRFHSDMIENTNRSKILNTYLIRVDRIFSEEKTWKTYFGWSEVIPEFNASNTIDTILTVFKLLGIEPDDELKEIVDEINSTLFTNRLVYK